MARASEGGGNRARTVAAVGLLAAGGLVGLARLRRADGPTVAPPAEVRHRVVVLGAGFGGVATALELDDKLGDRRDVDVLVVDRDNALLFTPLLWTVADGRANPSNVVVPVRDFQRGRRFRMLHAEVERVDLDRREVVTSAGPVPYDTLVVALGSVAAIPDLPGLREHARPFDTAGDALALRNHLIDAVETANKTADPAERRAWLTFVVGGGGDTGVEVAATIRTYLSEGLLAAYPWLATETPRIVIVGRAERLVPMSDAATSAQVRRALEGEGIEVWTGAAIEGVTDRAVVTSRGEIPSRTLFWAAGITAPPPVADLALEHARNGAVLVDDRLRALGRPEVFAIGDSAWAFDGTTGQPAPPTAQAAQHQGAYVAGVIVDALDGRASPPFRFAPRGHLALLGRRTAVARVGGMTIEGIPAWLLWHGYYLSQIPSWRNRIHLATNWLLSAITGRETAQVWLDRA